MIKDNLLRSSLLSNHPFNEKNRQRLKTEAPMIRAIKSEKALC